MYDIRLDTITPKGIEAFREYLTNYCKENGFHDNVFNLDFPVQRKSIHITFGEGLSSSEKNEMQKIIDFAIAATPKDVIFNKATAIFLTDSNNYLYFVDFLKFEKAIDGILDIKTVSDIKHTYKKVRDLCLFNNNRKTITWGSNEEFVKQITFSSDTAYRLVSRFADKTRDIVNKKSLAPKDEKYLLEFTQLVITIHNTTRKGILNYTTFSKGVMKAWEAAAIASGSYTKYRN